MDILRHLEDAGTIDIDMKFKLCFVLVFKKNNHLGNLHCASCEVPVQLAKSLCKAKLINEKISIETFWTPCVSPVPSLFLKLKLEKRQFSMEQCIVYCFRRSLNHVKTNCH